MHVAVLSGLIYLICRISRLRPRASVLIALSFALLYAVLALPAPPIVRSVILCAFISVGVMSRQSIEPIHLLCLSVLAMLIYHPLDLFNAGFQLSCGTVLGLMIFSTPLMKWFRGMREADAPRVVSGPRPFPTRAAAWCETWFTDAFAAGIIAWLVSMPLVAFHFEQVNFWAIPASIILAPIVFIGLVAGLLKVVLTLLFPSLAPMLAILAAQPMIWMRGVVGWLAVLPGNAFPLPAMSVAMLLAVYAVFLLWLIPTRRPKLRILLRCSPIAACLLALLLPLHAIRGAIVGQELRLTLLALGAGQCAVLETPGGKVVMIDAGSTSVSDLLS
jgi:competence protein ComEC